MNFTAKGISIFILLIFFCSCSKEVFTGLIENNITEYGKIFVSTNPKGYKIFIDNRNMAVISPDTVSYLTEGKHKLTLKHEVLSDTNMIVEVKKLSTQSFSIDMMKNPRFYSKIYCTTIPSGAKIYLNDQPTGFITPYTIQNLYPGQYEIKFLKNLCRDDSIVVKVKGGEYSQFNRILEDTTRTVSYRTVNSKVSSDLLSKVVVDKNNFKWIGSIDHGLMKFDGKNWTSFENANVLNTTRIQDLLIDKGNRLWVATAKGLSVFDGISWQSFDDKLPSQNVLALEEDVNGNIWVGTDNGLVKYNNISFQVFNKSNTEMPIDYVTALSSAKNGDVWIGTNRSGVIKYSGNKWTLYQTSQRDNLLGISDRIQDLIVDNNGRVWIFHKEIIGEEGLSYLTQIVGTNWTFIQLPILFALQVESFYLDVDSNVWMAIQGGLIKYSESKPLKVFDANEYGFFSRMSTSFAIDLKGDGWLTTMGAGIVKLKKGTF